MKTIYFTFLLIFITNTSLGQIDCINTVSTNPENPVNNSLPLDPTGQPDEQFLNKFDWLPIGAPGTPEGGLLLGYSLSNMEFAGAPLPIMSNIMSEQGTIDHYSYIYNGPMPISKNGWELLLVNVGRYPDNLTSIPVSTAELNSFPYIVLYNKYLGKIRVFCKFGLDQTVHSATDAVEIELSFAQENKYNSMMRLYAGNDRTLDQNTEVISMTAITKAQNFGNKWYSADFQVAYDPCVCSYPSQIKLTFAQIQHSEITAHSRTITLEDVDLINNDLVVEPSEWLSGFDYSGNSASGGIAIAKSLKTMTSRYIAELEQYKIDSDLTLENNKEVERRLAIMKLFENIIIEGGSLLISEVIGLPFFDKVDEFAKELIGTEVIDSVALVKEGKKQLAAGVKGLKTLIAGELKPLPKKPETPTATFSETSYSGQLVRKVGYAGPTFYTPGSYGTYGTGQPTLNSVYKYPVYNEPLGTFALLKKPKIIIKKYILHQENDLFQNADHPYTNLWRLGIQRYQAWSKSYKISLGEELKYTLNNNLDVKSYNIQASYVIKPKVKTLTIPTEARTSCFIDVESKINASLTNISSSDNMFIPLVTHGKNFHELHTNPELENFTTYWNGAQESVEQNMTMHLESPFIPIDAFTPFEVAFGVRNEVASYLSHQYTDTDVENWPYTTNPLKFDLTTPGIIKPNLYAVQSTGYELDFDIELRLLVNIEFNEINDQGKHNTVTEIHTFKIDNSNINFENAETYENLNQINNITMYPENLTIENIVFSGQNVNGCNLNNNSYTCRAWNDIKIKGNVSSTNGYDVNIIAGNQITEGSKSEITPEIIRRIEPALNFSHPNKEQTKEEVSLFCGDTNSPGQYTANIGTKSTIFNSLEDTQTTSYKNTSVDVTIYPNPTSNYINVKLSRSGRFNNFTLFDLFGRKIDANYEILTPNLAKVNLNKLQQGVYTLITNTSEGSFTDKIIINNNVRNN